MSDFKTLFYRITNQTEHTFDELKLRFSERMGFETVVHICPYNSFGNSTSLYIKGRVLHNRNIQTSNEDDWWDNLANMYKRFNSHEIKGAKLRVTFGSFQKEFFTDEDGYFGESVEVPASTVFAGPWCHPELELLESPIPYKSPVKATANVLIPSILAHFGVISDIDDTILKTNATSIAKMMYHTFTNNSHTRIPFHGVAAFYRALQKGHGGDDMNPLFYVSSSPWNLYDFLVDFMHIHAIPAGPIFLKDYGFTHEKLFTDGHGIHKTKKIKKIMDAFPEMRFILMGDSGQQDPEIYADIAKKYPGRILAIYIRDVSHDERDSEIATVFQSLGIEIIYSENSVTAAQHAIANGYINSECLEEIFQEKNADELREE